MKLIYITALVTLMLITGCGSNTQDTVEPADSEPVDEDSAAQDGVFREMPQSVKPGEQFTVVLHIVLNPEQDFYLINEKIPKEFSVIDKEVDSNNQLKLYKISEAVSRDIEYRVTAPDEPGSYIFSGEYAVTGMEKSAEILQDTEIIVN